MLTSLRAKLAVAGLSLVVPAAMFAQEETVTLPSSGVNIAEYANAAITSLGSVVAVCVGGVICFMIVRWGIRWVRSIGRG